MSTAEGAIQPLKDMALSLGKWDPLNWAERGQRHLHPRSLGHQSLSLPHTGRERVKTLYNELTKLLRDWEEGTN